VLFCGFFTEIALFPKWHGRHLKHRATGRLEKFLVDTALARVFYRINIAPRSD